MSASSREAGKRGLIVSLAVLLVVLIALDLFRSDSIVRAILGGDGGPRETFRRFLNSVRDGDVWPGPR